MQSEFFFSLMSLAVAGHPAVYRETWRRAKEGGDWWKRMRVSVALERMRRELYCYRACRLKHLCDAAGLELALLTDGKSGEPKTWRFSGEDWGIAGGV